MFFVGWDRNLFLGQTAEDDAVPNCCGTKCVRVVHTAEVSHCKDQGNESKLFFHTLDQFDVFDVVVDKDLVVRIVKIAESTDLGVV